MVVMKREEIQLRSAFTKLTEQQLGREGNKVCIFILIVITQYSMFGNIKNWVALCIWPLVRGPLPAMWHGRFHHDAIV